MPCPPPAEFERLGRVGPIHLGLGYVRRRPHCRELCGASGIEVPVRIERSPFAQMLGVRERLPNLCRRVGEVADENERQSARSGTRRVWLTAVHAFSFLRNWLSSKVSTCQNS